MVIEPVHIRSGRESHSKGKKFEDGNIDNTWHIKSYQIGLKHASKKQHYLRYKYFRLEGSLFYFVDMSSL
jgi:hypothetical protein